MSHMDLSVPWGPWDRPMGRMAHMVPVRPRVLTGDMGQGGGRMGGQAGGCGCVSDFCQSTLECSLNSKTYAIFQNIVFQKHVFLSEHCPMAHMTPKASLYKGGSVQLPPTKETGRFVVRRFCGSSGEVGFQEISGI